MNQIIKTPEEELEYDLVDTVMNSLRNNQVDYCFNTKAFEAILKLAKEQNINLVYKMFKDKYGFIDYVEFIPTNFYRVTSTGKRRYITGTYQYSHHELPYGWRYEHRKYADGPKKKETRKKAQGIDYLAKAEGKPYFF